MAEARKLYIKTYGCQMNVYDSERMAEALGASGYEVTDAPEQADMILLNTCHIREKAAEKVYSELGRLKPLKAANPDLRIGVAGCVAQAEGEEIMRRQPLVDLVVGPQTYHRLPAMEAAVRAGERAVDTEFPQEDKFEHLPRTPRTRRAPVAFLTVQEGCDKFCAFCVVPYTRGAEVSRPVERVLREARDLVERGVREITLLGQNVNAYHGAGAGGTWGLARLIREMARIDGLERIRFTTSHPNDMEDELIAAHGDEPKLMPYLHLPVQAGSDRILKRMNRNHTAESYIRLIERIRAARPDLMLSGDFIVGFPEETEADFQATLDLVEEVRFASAYSFKYSPRPGTRADEKLADDVPAEVKQARNARLLEIVSDIAEQDNRAFLGKTLTVLVEGLSKKPHLNKAENDDNPQLIGRTANDYIVVFNGPESLTGKFVNVNVTKTAALTLFGEYSE